LFETNKTEKLKIKKTDRMKKNLRNIFLCIALFSFHNLIAQIEGGVRDSTGKSLSLVTITVTDSTGKFFATVNSDSTGFYAIKGLLPGKYIIEAKAKGFQTAVYKNIEVFEKPKLEVEIRDISNATRLDIKLIPVKRSP
jgi:hypothetical protein